MWSRSPLYRLSFSFSTVYPCWGSLKAASQALSFTVTKASTAIRTSQRSTSLFTFLQLHPHVFPIKAASPRKTKPLPAAMNRHVKNPTPPTVNNDFTAVRSRAAPQQPSAVTDQTKQQDCAKMKPRHQTRQRGGEARERREREQDRGGKIKCQLWSCHGRDKKTIISGIWVNNSSLAVKLSLSKCKCC